MKRWVVFLLISSFVVLGVHSLAEASGLMGNYSVRIKVWQGDTLHEWEYDNPNHFEYEVGTKVIKGEEAKKAVREIVKVAGIHEQAEAEEMVKRIKQKFPDLTRFEARYMNEKGKLFTWVWKKESNE
ncbi:hypothetical protein P4637_05195 [Halalkalibacterium halodurans]|uniref:BH3181 protein n=2 Tax=Halalkalibacterium halodurans TaxID=86665 RepID=Q9K826_HALH5|nr:hypothetical protein [Halalkalibacterium halodurans]MDY7223714.1 hypothetical protein [Halalkalibacterium halodurans]MDY7242935.1 hypothetical protein [Halalkalibacterium halodurans]MED3648027.1 hypothetical protein [Halalkalibacterium halodurans]MED4082163.1 hypothetical protein [Halalkalibacterium halodurans]MED4084259.1 hypothetical protein [Halalkalibacterium halodurans]